MCILISGCALFEPPEPPPPAHFRTVVRAHEPATDGNAYYLTEYQVILPFTGTVQIVVQYQDLAFEFDPVVETHTLLAQDATLVIKSPALPAPQPYADYEILLQVYSDAELTDLLTTHRNWVRFFTER